MSADWLTQSAQCCFFLVSAVVGWSRGWCPPPSSFVPSHALPPALGGGYIINHISLSQYMLLYLLITAGPPARPPALERALPVGMFNFTVPCFMVHGRWSPWW